MIIYQKIMNQETKTKPVFTDSKNHLHMTKVHHLQPKSFS